MHLRFVWVTIFEEHTPKHVSLQWAACSYNCPTPVADDYAKEPSVMPAHLQLTLLNVPPALDAQAVLPRPQHVILNHVYCQRGQVGIAWCHDECKCIRNGGLSLILDLHTPVLLNTARSPKQEFVLFL